MQEFPAALQMFAAVALRAARMDRFAHVPRFAACSLSACHLAARPSKPPVRQLPSMKNHNVVSKTFLSILLFLGFLSAGLPENLDAQVRYDFNTLASGSLGGQDSWMRPSGVHAVVVTGTGINPTRAVANSTNGDANARRLFVLPYAASQVNAAFEVDMQWQIGTVGYSRSLVTGGLLNSGTAWPAFQVGLYSAGNTRQFYLGASNSEGILTTYKSLVPASIPDGAWLRLRLAFDFTANGGQGAVTLFYRNLSDSSSDWTLAGPATSNVSLSLGSLGHVSARNPANWNFLSLRLNNLDSSAASAIAVDNLVASPEYVPTVFWAHYMPQVPSGFLGAHPHAGGSLDSWPFLTQRGNPVERYEEHMLLALDSGINGFQMLGGVPEDALTAARNIRNNTGRTFFLAPEWTGLNGKSVEEVLAIVGPHANNRKDDPHSFRLGGRQVQFFYGDMGSWGETNGGILDMRSRLAAAEQNVLLIPTLYNFDKIALDRPDLVGKAWPSPPSGGAPNWLRETGWEGATGFNMLMEPAVRQLLADRLEEEGNGFRWMPSVSAGYNSSNRPSQAIHVPYQGLGTIWNNLRFWVDRGYKQMTLLTWNDCMETMLIPTSRNVWGYNAIIRYLSHQAATGLSPFRDTKTVVSYPVECLYGDNYFFQILALPAAGEAVELRATVRLQPAEGGAPILLQGSGTASANNPEVFIEKRVSTSDWTNYCGLQPFVTIDVRTLPSGSWRRLHEEVPLGVTRLRYNIINCPAPYAVDLDRIDTGSQAELSFTNTGPIQKAAVNITAGQPVRRLMLMEGTRNLGAFRNTDVVNGTWPYRNLFLRCEASENLAVTLTAKNGWIHDIFNPHYDLGNTLQSVSGTSARFSAFPSGGFPTRVARVDMREDGRLALALEGRESEALDVVWRELLNGTVTRSVDYNGRPVTLTLALTTDATDAVIDYPLPASGSFARSIPAYPRQSGIKVLQCLAWLDSGKVSYSNPCALADISDTAVSLVQMIETRGVFDDFVSEVSSKSLNPFGAGDITTGLMSKTAIPYFYFGFNGSPGPRFFDHGTSQQLGRGWLERDGVSGINWQVGTNFQQISGVYGKAIRLLNGSRIRLRSKSSPAGPVTTSLSVHLSGSSGTGGNSPANRLIADNFILEINAAGKGVVTFAKAEISATLPPFSGLQPGWNHLIFCYDLKSLSVYLNGTRVAYMADVKPVYQRTHQTPCLGFESKAAVTLGFDGGLDEVEIIGTGLSAIDALTLSPGRTWKVWPLEPQ